MKTIISVNSKPESLIEGLYSMQKEIATTLGHTGWFSLNKQTKKKSVFEDDKMSSSRNPVDNPSESTSSMSNVKSLQST